MNPIRIHPALLKAIRALPAAERKVVGQAIAEAAILILAGLGGLVSTL